MVSEYQLSSKEISQTYGEFVALFSSCRIAIVQFDKFSFKLHVRLGIILNLFNALV